MKLRAFFCVFLIYETFQFAVYFPETLTSPIEDTCNVMMVALVGV